MMTIPRRLVRMSPVGAGSWNTRTQQAGTTNMTNYAAVRTDRDLRPLILKEAYAGRLRQGWGWEDHHDLHLIRTRRLSGETLSDDERAAWGNRRLLEQAWNGLQEGDVLVLPNLPEPGTWLLARITGDYRFDRTGEFLGHGHVRPIEVLRTPDRRPAVVHPTGEFVTAGLRRSMCCQHRMWSLDGHADALETIIEALAGGAAIDIPTPMEQRLERFTANMRERAYALIDETFGGAELEQLVLRVLRSRYRAAHPKARVLHKGGRGEHGIDVLVELPDPLGVDLRIGVQVKKHDGVEWSKQSLAQLREARDHWGIHAGVVLTTAPDFTETFETARAELEDDLRIPIRVILREEFVDMVLTNLVDRLATE